jgi:hypothetical protein
MSKTINNGRAVDIIYKKAFTVIYTKLSYDYGRHVGIFFFSKYPCSSKKTPKCPSFEKIQKRDILVFFGVTGTFRKEKNYLLAGVH